MAITTEAGLIAARAGSMYAPFVKSTVANAVAGQKFSLYRAAGSIPAQPATPTTAVVCDGATVGAILNPLTMVGGNTLYIDSINVQSTIAAQFEVVDRVIHSGGLNGTLLTAQTVNTPALPARAPAGNCRWYLEWYTDTGATASNATVAYTRFDASTGTAIIAVGGTVRAGRKIEVVNSTASPIASVQSVTLSASTGTAGNFGVVCEKQPGVKAGILAGNGTIEYESLMRSTGSASPCLAINVYCTTTSTGAIDGGMQLMQG